MRAGAVDGSFAHPLTLEFFLSKKQKIISGYLAIGFLFAIYGWLFGPSSYKGFFYNIGIGLVWPTVIFPSLGPVLGGIVIVLFVAIILVLG